MIHFLERDGRKSHADFKQTMGSFSVICSILEKELRKLNLYSDNIDEAKYVGIADSLATDFYIPNKKCFGIYFIDCANTVQEITLQRIRNNPNLKLFCTNKHTSKIFEKYGVKCTPIGPGIDSEYWTYSGSKFSEFTFIHSGFSNIRSGLDILIKSFDLAFRGNKDVRLIIKDTSNSEKLKEKIKEYIGLGNNIIHITKRINFDQLKLLYGASHVFCSVFRHSGHGLGIGEAACVNCLPFVGDFEPSNEIANESFARLIKPSQLIKVNEIKPYLVSEWGLTDTFGSLSFAEEPMIYDYSIPEYAQKMLDIYKKNDILNIRDNAMGVWDSQRSARILVSNILNE